VRGDVLEKVVDAGVAVTLVSSMPSREMAGVTCKTPSGALDKMYVKTKRARLD
jgi:hypothetical protein